VKGSNELEPLIHDILDSWDGKHLFVPLSNVGEVVKVLLIDEQIS